MNRSIAWSAVIFLFVVGVYGYLHSATFTVQSVQVVGHKSLAAETIVQEAQVPLGSNIFSLSTGEIAERLRQNPMIARAVVKRRLPRTVVLEVRERVPVCIISGAEGLFYLGDDGKILSPMGKGRVDMPVVVGYAGELSVGTSLPSPITSVLRELHRFGASVWPDLSEINLSDRQEIIAFTTGNVRVRFGDGTNLERKTQVLAALLNQAQNLQEIDLRSPETPVVKKR